MVTNRYILYENLIGPNNKISSQIWILVIITCKNSCKSCVVPWGEGSVSTENDVPHGEGDSIVNEDLEGEWRNEEFVGDTLKADSEGVPSTSR